MKDYNSEEIANVIKTLDDIRGRAIKDQLYGFNDNWITFMSKMRILTPQSSGARIQNYIFRALGWESVPASLNKGDVKNSLGQYYEVKITLISSSNLSANIVQIRMWQSISGHHIFVIDTTNNYEVTHFSLSKYDMEQEVKLCGNSAHGTKIANLANQNVEWSIRINWNVNDDTYKRWIVKYKQESNIGRIKGNL
jgi:hypothetical protein